MKIARLKEIIREEVKKAVSANAPAKEKEKTRIYVTPEAFVGIRFSASFFYPTKYDYQFLVWFI